MEANILRVRERYAKLEAVQEASTKVKPVFANYRPAFGWVRCGECRFRTGEACQLVRGAITEHDVCDLFAAEVEGVLTGDPRVYQARESYARPFDESKIKRGNPKTGNKGQFAPKGAGAVGGGGEERPPEAKGGKNKMPNRKTRVRQRAAEMADWSAADLLAYSETASGVEKEAAAYAYQHLPEITAEREASNRRSEQMLADRETQREAQVAEQMPLIHKALLAAGYELEHTSDFGSRYYRRGHHNVRVADHAVPQTPERSGGSSWAPDPMTGRTRGDEIILPALDIAETLQWLSELNEDDDDGNA
jgi:hypothetical protein